MTAVSKELEAALQRCNMCGFCLAHCPIYKVTGIEWTAARGRIALINAALLGEELDISEIKDPVYNCLTCNACLDDCPGGVTTADIIFDTRGELLKRQGQPWIQKVLFNKVLPNPSLLHKATRLLRLADITGLRTLGRKTGITGLIGDFGKAEAVVPKVPSSGGVEALRSLIKKVEKPKAKVAYFAGCHAPNLAPDVAVATIRVLNKHQVDVVIPDFVCCGLPATGYGDMTSAKNFARTNIDLAKKLDVDAIVTPCASCSSFLKDYVKLCAGDPELEEKAKEFSAKVRDISEFLVDIGLVTDGLGTIKKKVTFHDPCHLGRYQKIKAQPRTILKSIPGVDFVELPESDMCCGAAGSYAFTHYDLSMKVRQRKMGNVEKTGADILVSSCPACVMQLTSGVSQNKFPVRVYEIVKLLDEAYQAAKDNH